MITPRQLEILQHALGLNKYGRCAAHEDPRQCRDFGVDLPGHRNRFCAGGECLMSPVPAHPECDVCVCRQLVEMGLMVQHETTSWLPYYNVSVSDLGRRAVREQSPAAPRLTRAQKRYRRFLRLDMGMTFGEFLRSDYSREAQCE